MRRKILLKVTDSKPSIKSGTDAVLWLEEAIESETGKEIVNALEIPCIFEYGDCYLADNREQINNYIDELSRTLLDVLVPKLNEIHQQAGTKKQWEVLISFWINRYVSSFYIKYLKLKNVREKYPSDELILSVRERKQALIAGEIVDFLLLSRQNDLFCELQYCDLAELFDYSVDKSADSSDNQTETGAITAGNALLAKKKEYKKQCKTLLYCSYLPNDLISFMETVTDGRIRNYPGVPLNYINSSLANTPIETEMRKNLYLHVESEDSFLCFLAERIGDYIPKSYVEGFNALSDIASRYFDVNPRGVITAPAGLTHDDLFKVFLFHKRQNIVLYDVQHGGNYGLIDPADRIERMIADRFYTFGWRDESWRRQLIPMPAAIGLRFLHYNGKTDRSRRILYTGYSLEKYRSNLIDYYTAARLNKMETDFFGALNDELLKRIVVRLIVPFRDDMNRSDFFRNNYPEVTVRHCLPFQKELANACLLVAPGIDTTYLEAMWTGTPVIIVCPPDTYLATKVGGKMLERLKQAEILIDSPTQAAELITKIAGHELEWWMEHRRQKIVCEFKRRYASLPAGSYLKWALELFKTCYRGKQDGGYSV